MSSQKDHIIIFLTFIIIAGECIQCKAVPKDSDQIENFIVIGNEPSKLSSIVKRDEKYENCFRWDKPYVEADNKKPSDIFHECGIHNGKEAMIYERYLCAFKETKVMTEEGYPNMDKFIKVLKDYAYPQFMDAVLNVANECGKNPNDLEPFFVCLGKGFSEACPKDEIFHSVEE